MVQVLHTFTPPGPSGHGRVERCPHDQRRRSEGMLLTQVAQALKESDVAWEIVLAETPQYPQGGCEQGPQARGAMLVHVTTGVCLLRLLDALVERALQRPRAAGGGGGEPTPGVDGAVGGLLHGLHGKIARRLAADRPLTTDPGAERGPVCVVVAPPGLAFLPTATGAAPHRLRATAWRLSLVAGSMGEVSGCPRALQPPIGVVGAGGIPAPPAPAIPGPPLDAPLAGHPPRRTRETEEKRRPHPGRQ
jgi:hypothetical protein